MQWKGRKVVRKNRESRGPKQGVEAPRVFIDAVKYCVAELTDTLKAKVSGKSRFLANNKPLLEACMKECKKWVWRTKGKGR